MKKKLSSVSFWLIVFFSLVAVEAYSAFAQSPVVGSWKNGSVGSISYQNRVTGSKPRYRRDQTGPLFVQIRRAGYRGGSFTRPLCVNEEVNGQAQDLPLQNTLRCINNTLDKR